MKQNQTVSSEEELEDFEELEKEKSHHLTILRETMRKAKESKKKLLLSFPDRHELSPFYIHFMKLKHQLKNKKTFHLMLLKKRTKQVPKKLSPFAKLRPLLKKPLAKKHYLLRFMIKKIVKLNIAKVKTQTQEKKVYELVVQKNKQIKEYLEKTYREETVLSKELKNTSTEPDLGNHSAWLEEKAKLNALKKKQHYLKWKTINQKDQTERYKLRLHQWNENKSKTTYKAFKTRKKDRLRTDIGVSINKKTLGFTEASTKFRQSFSGLISDVSFDKVPSLLQNSPVVSLTKDEQEQLEIEKKMKKELRSNVVKQLPKLVMIVGQKREMRAVKECQKLNIPTITFLDTDGDPSLTNFFIPTNTKNYYAMDYLLTFLCSPLLSARLLSLGKKYLLKP